MFLGSFIVLTSLRRKYRILDDCARLRDIAEQLGTTTEPRFTPALLVLTWTEFDEPDVASDFGDMVCNFHVHTRLRHSFGCSEKIAELLHMRMITSAQYVSISGKTTDWDRKFLEALALIKLDLVDKTLVTLTFSGARHSRLRLWSANDTVHTDLCDPYIQSFRVSASDWLDSCWTGDQCTSH